MPLLEAKDLSVHFAIKRGWGNVQTLKAVDEVSFAVEPGQTLAIVGESGSGKTTAALAVGRLVAAAGGTVTLGGEDFLALSDDDLRKARAKVQFIFQDPYSSLNPRRRAEEIVREPLDSLTDMSEAEKRDRVAELFAAVGLRPEQQRLFPHQFSGGQRQRISIARALATRPSIIICDEPVSALDVAVQAQVLNLLRKLQEEYGLTYLFISHDLGVVQHMCDMIAVMYMGRIVEYGSRMQVFSNPLHPYTKALLSAVPTTDRKRREETKRILIPGDPPDPMNLPAGCRFANRCPAATDLCRQTDPMLRSDQGDHAVACHLVRDNQSPI